MVSHRNIFEREVMKNRGFTFVEILFVVLVISVFVSVVSPTIFNYLEEARKDKVKIDLQMIEEMMIVFEWDTKLLPRSNGSSPNDQSLEIVFLGRPYDLPKDNEWGDWKIEVIKKETHFLRRDLYANHLLRNDPNVNKVYGDEGDYRVSNQLNENSWRGPYFDSPEIRQDPWGRAYMISFFKNQDSRLMCKAVSAGPNGKLELKPFVLVDDEEIIKNSDDYVKYFQKF